LAGLPGRVWREPLRAVVMMVLLVISVSYLVMGAHNPFIYFNF